MKRINSIDIVRGLVMVIMALDHTRDLMHVNSITQNPLDFFTTTSSLFLTRWITHLCAPIFVFLAGVSAYMSLKNSTNITETRQHLLKRGLFLMVLDFTVINFAIFFDIGFHTLIFQVIASTGFGFVMLSLLQKFSTKQLGILGLLILFCYSFLSLIPLDESSVLKLIITPFFSFTTVPLFSGKSFLMIYPPIPWLGIMLLGFASGQFFELAKEKRDKLFTKIGVGALLLFVILRAINFYGDPQPWSTQKNAVFTFLSFININKYPPSLDYCLATLGIMFLLLVVSGRWSAAVKNILVIYGKVPLFYYIMHFYLIHIITLAVLWFQGFSFSEFEFATGTLGRPKGIESGLPLWAIYIVWLSVVAALYFPCKWYGNYKASHKNSWLKYI